MHQAIPGWGGGRPYGALASPGRPPPPPPTHIRKLFLRQKMKFIKGAGNLRPNFGTQTLTPPPPTHGGGLLKQ